MFVDAYSSNSLNSQVASTNLQLKGPFSEPSPLLRRVRAQLINSTLSFYEPVMDKMINIINDYIGGDEEQEKAISQDKNFSPEQLFLFEAQRYKKKTMMRVEDRQNCVEWVRDIISKRREHAKLLPIALEPGDSEGITYVIMKAKKIYGYLYGTMHNFSRGLQEAEILTRLSPITHLRLLNCSIIGTEVTVKNEPSHHSVEGALMRIADEVGIANIGIDDATCHREMVGVTVIDLGENSKTFLPKIEEPKFKELDDIEELARYFKGAKDYRSLNRITTIALHNGMIELAWSGALLGGKDSEYQQTLQKQRHQAMAENIHALLSACETIESENQNKPPKCFFALGISHLIATPSVPESVVELVAKKGWTVARIVTNETRLALSREMTAREVNNLGTLIMSMRQHPLYVSQKVEVATEPYFLLKDVEDVHSKMYMRLPGEFENKGQLEGKGN